MLSRTASALYWLGRYVERAEFTARLVEATLRLDALTPEKADLSAWKSALEVLGQDADYLESGAPITQEAVTRHLTISRANPGSVVSCMDAARDNAKAVRTALSREAWSSINRAWLIFHSGFDASDTQQVVDLVAQAEMETRGFEGAIGRMLRNPSSYFIRIGSTLERADNTARLLDVKYHLILPVGEQVGGRVDRDQWQTILHTLSAVNAYRWLYREGLKSRSVIEMLTLRRELPRSLLSCIEELLVALNAIGKVTGLQGEADRVARQLHTGLRDATVRDIITSGLHEFLTEFISGTAALDRAIARQFRFH
jgi:uncharacterized alpha-E superfamily protein